MSLCCYVETEAKTLYGSERYAKHELLSAESDTRTASAKLVCSLAPNICPIMQYSLSKEGVDIEIFEERRCGFMLPVLEFDGINTASVTEKEGQISVSYQRGTCTYYFEGSSQGYEIYCNRNGRYRVYRVDTKKGTVIIKSEQ